MTRLTAVAMATRTARAYQTGAPDAYGKPPERAVSDGAGNPCRHCLGFIPEGDPMLILAHRPFPQVQPYAETGPIFLCAAACARWDGDGMPPVLTRAGEDRLLKAYSPADRIVYGLGTIVAPEQIPDSADAMLDDPRVAYVHVRSSTNNCFTCRIERP